MLHLDSRKAQRAEPDPDYYEVLGLSRAAPGFTEQELRRQYRKLAVRYHPDKTGGDAEGVDAHKLSLRQSLSLGFLLALAYFAELMGAS